MSKSECQCDECKRACSYVPDCSAKTVAEIVAERKAASAMFALLPLTRGQLGATIGAMNKALGGNANRHAVTKYLFGESSTSKLSDGDKFSLYNWVDAWQDENGEWQCGECFEGEALLVLRYALMQEGQQDMFGAMTAEQQFREVRAQTETATAPKPKSKGGSQARANQPPPPPPTWEGDLL
jgi:hypothetical protein